MGESTKASNRAAIDEQFEAVITNGGARPAPILTDRMVAKSITGESVVAESIAAEKLVADRLAAEIAAELAVALAATPAMPEEEPRFGVARSLAKLAEKAAEDQKTATQRAVDIRGSVEQPPIVIKRAPTEQPAVIVDVPQVRDEMKTALDTPAITDVGEPVAGRAPAVTVKGMGPVTVAPPEVESVEPAPIVEEPPTGDAIADGIATAAQHAIEDDLPMTRKQPALVEPAPDDLVAKKRGFMPIGSPYVKTLMQTPPRRVLIASLCVTGVCIAIAASTVIWARNAVGRAEQAARSSQVASAEEPARPEGLARMTATIDDSAVAPTNCALSLRSNIAEATLWIDGEARGKAATTKTIDATCGKPVLVEVRHPRYEHFKRTLTPSGGELEIVANLEREKTQLTLWSEPAGAEVTYNGRVLGKTPLVTQVPRYEQGTLWFKAPGKKADWRRILPKQETKTVSIKLRSR